MNESVVAVIDEAFVRQLQARILSDARHFHMKTWELATTCGTVHCIGGLAAVLKGIRIDQTFGSYSAAAALGLQPHQRWVFFADQWPLNFEEHYRKCMYGAAGMDYAAAAQVAVDVLDYLLAHPDYAGRDPDDLLLII